MKHKKHGSLDTQDFRCNHTTKKMQKSRGKISTDEWNAAVAYAQEMKARTERGKLSDEEMRAAFEMMGRD